MVEINDGDTNSTFPLEATAFLAAVSAFAVFLLVIFMYVNKKWHLFNVNIGSPDGNHVRNLQQQPAATLSSSCSSSSIFHSIRPLQLNNVNLKSQLGESYTIASPDSSSDSEEDVLRRLQNNIANNNGNGQLGISQQAPSSSYMVHHNQSHQQQHLHHNQNSSVAVALHGFSTSFDEQQLSQGSPLRGVSSSAGAAGSSGHHHNILHHQPLSQQFSNSPKASVFEGRNRRLQLLHQQRSLDLDYMSTGSPSRSLSHQFQSHYNNPVVPPLPRPASAMSHYSAPPSMMQSMSRRPLRVSTIRDIDDGASQSSNGSRRRSHHQKGLIRSATAGARSSAHRHHETDLMSLAEKGKVCRESSASSTSSNVSADDDFLRNHAASLAAMRNHQPHPMNPPPQSHHGLHHHHQFHQSASTNPSAASNSQPGTSNIISSNGNPTRQPLSRSSSTSTSRCGDSIRETSIQTRHHHHHQHHPSISSSNSAPGATTGTLTMVNSNPNFRRMMLPPRTKSVDSESPPPSEQGLSTYGDSCADQDDHIFEEMSMEEGELGMIVERTRRIPTSPVQCGDFEVAFDYEAVARKLTVHVIQAKGIPNRDMGGASHTQIRIVLLQQRKQRHKTKVRAGENPQFMESFVFNKINPEDVSSLGIRFRLYGCERMRRERLLGECVLGFGSIHLELETTLWLSFEPKYQLSWDSHSECESLARSDSASSTQSIQTGIPELLIGLAYNGTTGRLTAEIIKGSHFRNLAGGRAPDSYIKLVLVGINGQEMGRAKSSLRRAQSNPLFKETFMFQVALFQVSEVTLLVSIYGRKGVTRRELLGWFALGYNSSGDEEATHWEDMCDAQGDQMCRWHVLLQS